MGLWESLFGGPKKRKSSKKKATRKVAKKSAGKGLKHFVIFDKNDDRVVERVSAKTETQAWKSWAKGRSNDETDGIRIMTAARWAKEQA